MSVGRYPFALDIGLLVRGANCVASDMMFKMQGLQGVVLAGLFAIAGVTGIAKSVDPKVKR